MRARLLDLHDVSPADLEAWQALAAAAAEPNPFFEPAAVLPAARLLSRDDRVALLCAGEGAELALALPVVRRRGYRRLPVRALVGWQHEYAFLGTPLVRPGAGTAAWAAVLALLRASRDAAWLALPRLSSTGPAAAGLAAAASAHVTDIDAYDRPVVHRRPEPTYLDGRISSRHLKSLRRLRRRLGDQLGGEVVAVDRAGDPAAVEGLLSLEASGWKGTAGTAMALHPAHAQLFRETCSAFAAEGRLQLWSLEVAGRAAAYQCNVVAGDTVFHVKVAYDGELAACSPGLQLELDMVEEFHRDQRLERIDSCVDPGNKVSTQLYPDVMPLVTRLVGWAPQGRAAARTLPHLLAGKAHADRLRSRP